MKGESRRMAQNVWSIVVSACFMVACAKNDAPPPASAPAAPAASSSAPASSTDDCVAKPATTDANGVEHLRKECVAPGMAARPADVSLECWDPWHRENMCTKPAK